MQRCGVKSDLAITQNTNPNPTTPIPIATNRPPTLFPPILRLIPLAPLLFAEVEGDEEEELPVADAAPLLDELVPFEPAAPLDVPPEEREPRAEGRMETGDHVPPLVVVFGSYARKATLPDVVSCTRALVEAK